MKPICIGVPAASDIEDVLTRVTKFELTSTAAGAKIRAILKREGVRPTRYEPLASRAANMAHTICDDIEVVQQDLDRTSVESLAHSYQTLDRFLDKEIKVIGPHGGSKKHKFQVG